MERIITTLLMLLLVMAGCGGGSSRSAEEIVTVDISANYPEKELILQDFMDVEYIPLETNDEFLTQGNVKAVGKELLLVTNRTGGDILFFDRTGKSLRLYNE